MAYDEQEYHRRRSEMELEQAISADDPGSARAHLELARMHRARRQLIAREELGSSAARHGASVFRTDKEA